MSQNNYIKCVFLGDISVGKSSFLNRIVDNTFYPNIESTIGAAFRVKIFDFENISISIKVFVGRRLPAHYLMFRLLLDV